MQFSSTFASFISRSSLLVHLQNGPTIGKMKVESSHYLILMFWFCYVTFPRQHAWSTKVSHTAGTKVFHSRLPPYFHSPAKIHQGSLSLQLSDMSPQVFLCVTWPQIPPKIKESTSSPGQKPGIQVRSCRGHSLSMVLPMRIRCLDGFVYIHLLCETPPWHLWPPCFPKHVVWQRVIRGASEFKVRNLI